MLGALGVAFEVRDADIDETVLPGEDPIAYVTRLAMAKAAAVAACYGGGDGAVPDAGQGVAAGGGSLVIAADTTVVIGGEILGKPSDRGEATAMMRKLSGRTHHVHTGVAVQRGSAQAVGVATTAVTFLALSDETITWYTSLDEPYDKAGGYALQGAGVALLDRVEGNVANVIGLPVPLLLSLATSLGVTLVP
jgi:septum formation protein